MWRRGVFFGASNPLENHGVLGDRVVLLDHSGLTEDPRAIRDALDTVRAQWLDQTRGLYAAGRPAGAPDAFERRLAALMQPAAIRRYWPTPDDPRWDD